MNGGGEAPRREFVRADDELPVYYEVVDEGYNLDKLKGWDALFDDIEPGPEENPKLYELLFDINQKLNILVNYLSNKNGFNIPEAKDVNISGGGLQFYCFDKFEIGDRIMVKTFLPTTSHILRVKGEVVRVMPRDGGGYFVALKYIDLDEPTREKIIRYVFSRQRKTLRDGKSSNEE